MSGSVVRCNRRNRHRNHQVADGERLEKEHQSRKGEDEARRPPVERLEDCQWMSPVDRLGTGIEVIGAVLSE